MHNVFLVLAAFLASCVEMVEAMTIILAVGVTKGWRTSIAGVVCAAIALAVLVAILGKSLIDIVPLDVLQVTVGVLLLVFGMQWLRKAILRTAGLKAEHDEDQIFADEVRELRSEGSEQVAGTGIDWQGFVVSFKGVFLEGLEVAFIVVTFGANSGRLDLAAGGATAAFFLVSAVGLVLHRPLANVPENAIKHTVGVMLMAFGTFWGAEGVGVNWQLDAVTIPLLGGFYWLASLALIAMLERASGSPRLRQATEAKA